MVLMGREAQSCGRSCPKFISLGTEHIVEMAKRGPVIFMSHRKLGGPQPNILIMYHVRTGHMLPNSVATVSGRLSWQYQ